jgi:hypothetical protein
MSSRGSCSNLTAVKKKLEYDDEPVQVLKPQHKPPVYKSPLPLVRQILENLPNMSTIECSSSGRRNRT